MHAAYLLRSLITGACAVVRRRLRPGLDNWRCILALEPRSHQSAAMRTRYCVDLLQEVKHAVSRPKEQIWDF